MESVNILVNSNGQVVRSEVVGALKMRTYLRYVEVMREKWAEGALRHVAWVGRLPPRIVRFTHHTCFALYRLCGQWLLSIQCQVWVSSDVCSGMPECKLGLNDRVLLEAQGRAAKGKAIDLDDIKFHQWVHYWTPSLECLQTWCCSARSVFSSQGFSASCCLGTDAVWFWVVCSRVLRLQMSA